MVVTVAQSSITRSSQPSPEPIPPPAWQRGQDGLAAKWERITGRYIFQAACTSCHSWGPAYWPREEWRAYFKEFPRNHDPDVREKYRDLTALFDARRLVPNLTEEQHALETFVLTAAPEMEVPIPARTNRFNGLPKVGQPAPEFALNDIGGRPISLSQFKNKKALVLIFSRAHW